MIGYEIKLPLGIPKDKSQDVSISSCLEASSLIASLIKDNDVQEVHIRHKFMVDGKPQETDSFIIDGNKIPVISVVPAGIMSEDDNIYYSLVISCGDDFHISKDIWSYDTKHPDEAYLGVRFEGGTKKVLVIAVGVNKEYYSHRYWNLS